LTLLEIFVVSTQNPTMFEKSREIINFNSVMSMTFYAGCPSWHKPSLRVLRHIHTHTHTLLTIQST